MWQPWWASWMLIHILFLLSLPINVLKDDIADFVTPREYLRTECDLQYSHNSDEVELDVWLMVSSPFLIFPHYLECLPFIPVPPHAFHIWQKMMFSRASIRLVIPAQRSGHCLAAAPSTLLSYLLHLWEACETTLTVNVTVLKWNESEIPTNYFSLSWLNV
jgi:hypothetical protein